MLYCVWQNPLLILTMTPFLTKTWRWQSTDDAECCGTRCTEQDTLSKLAWGHVMVGLSFLFLSAAGYSLGADISGDSDATSANPESAQEKVSFLWVLAHIMLLTLGELHVQPVGLSFISRYAPDGCASIMMGVWYTGECKYSCGKTLLSLILVRCGSCRWCTDA